MNNNSESQIPFSALSDLFKSADTLLQNLKSNIDPFQEPTTLNKEKDRVTNPFSRSDLPKLVSPKPQRPTPQHLDNFVTRSLSNQSMTTVQRNLSQEFPNNSFQSVLSRQPSINNGFQSIKTDQQQLIKSSDIDMNIQNLPNSNFKFENSSNQQLKLFSKISSSSTGQTAFTTIQQNSNSYQNSQQADEEFTDESNNYSFNKQNKSNGRKVSQTSTDQPPLNNQLSLTFGKSFHPFTRGLSESNVFMSKAHSQVEEKPVRPFTNPFTSALRQISQQQNENSNNKQSIGSLPECIVALFKQATLKIKSESNQQPMKSAAVNQSSALPAPILGKRLRYNSKSFVKSDQESMEISSIHDDNNSSICNSHEEEINQLTQNQLPNKRKHVSSLSKAMLAKKILTKIETENNPSENVVPKIQQTVKDVSMNETSGDLPLQYQQSSNEDQVNIQNSNPNQTSTEQSQVKSCNCKRSKCLKLYCECFANNKFCGSGCACNGCSNDSEHDDERLQAKEQILMRNPLAFRPKIETSLDENSLFKKDIKIDQINLQQQSEVLLQISTKHVAFGALAVSDKEKRHFKGCNCKKSYCQKKYCECFQSGVNCTDMCKCEECKNNETCKPCTFELMFKVHREERTPLKQNPNSIINDQKQDQPFQDLTGNFYKQHYSEHNIIKGEAQNSESCSIIKPIFNALKQQNIQQQQQLVTVIQNRSPIGKASKLKKENQFNQENNPPQLFNSY